MRNYSAVRIAVSFTKLSKVYESLGIFALIFGIIFMTLFTKERALQLLAPLPWEG